MMLSIAKEGKGGGREEGRRERERSNRHMAIQGRCTFQKSGMLSSEIFPTVCGACVVALRQATHLCCMGVIQVVTRYNVSRTEQLVEHYVHMLTTLVPGVHEHAHVLESINA